MKRFVRVAVVAAAGVIALLAGSAVWADEGGIPAEPVQAKPVGHGLKLWVFVHYGKGDNGKGPGGRPGGGGGAVDCTDTNTQTDFAAPFAFARHGGLTFHVNESTVPSSVSSSADSALGAAAAAWNAVSSGYLTLASNGTATGPAQDGVNTIGWARIVPKNVLAATWAWADSSNHIVEADVFYNKTQPWTVFTSCPSNATGNFDVADIGTHEIGHALGLNHYSDGEAQSTMYPSAPADEVRKTTLTGGDINAFNASLSG